MDIKDRIFKSALLLCAVFEGNSCNASGLSYTFDLNQPLQFSMSRRLTEALDEPGRKLYQSAALHAAEALGAEASFISEEAGGNAENSAVQLTLGDVDCTGDRAGYVRWRPNNILQVCPSMLREHNQLLVTTLIMHEMGHVLGGNHVACDGESLLAPDLNCPTQRLRQQAEAPQRLWYSAQDLTEICRNTVGGVCADRPGR